MSTAGERESYEALRSSYIHLLSFFDTSAVHLGAVKIYAQICLQARLSEVSRQ